MSKPTFALDLDGVCYNWTATINYLLKEHRGVELPKVHTSWDMAQEMCSNNDWQWLWSEGIRKGMFRHGHLFKGTIDAVNELAKMVDITVVTSRPALAHKDTLDWLSFHQFPIKGLVIMGKDGNKADYPMNFHLDDGPKVLKDLMSSNLRGMPGQIEWVIKWNRPYNTDSPCDIAVSSWKEVIEIVAHKTAQTA